MRCFLTALLLLPMVAFTHTDQLNVIHTKSSAHFDAVRVWYSQAESISFQEAQKNFGEVLEGQCFRANSKNKGISGVLVLTSKEASKEDLTPNSPSKTWIENKVAILASMGPSPFSKSELLSEIHNGWMTFQEALLPDSYLKFEQMGMFGEVRVFSSWLVALIQNAEDITFQGTDCKNVFGDQCVDGILPKGSTIEACYYYEELE